MFFNGNHKDIFKSIEAIGTAFAVFEFLPESNNFELVSCNSLYENIAGKATKDLIGQFLLSLFPRYISNTLQNSFLQCKSEQVGLETEFFVDYKGKERWWRSIISPIIEATNGKLRIIQTCVEITEKIHLEKDLNFTLSRFEAVVQSAYDGIITIDDSHNIKLVNESAMSIFGYNSKELIGAPLTKLLPQRYRKNHTPYVDGFKNSRVSSRAMETRASVSGLRKDGSEFPIEVTISKISVSGTTEMTAVIRDISEKNTLLEELLITSRVDPLTDLFNRRYFSELLDAEISRANRYKRGISLLMIDIDHFKKVNDTYGHQCGDMLLKAFSKSLTNELRETDIIGRWGGEEFLILLPETGLLEAIRVAEKVRTKVESMKPVYNKETITFTISLGVASFTEDVLNQEMLNKADLIKLVDKKLYEAKNSGRNQVSS